MTETTRQKIPAHLQRYVVNQDYDRYTPEDQAVWRFIMRQLKDYLRTHAHESYLTGLERTGLSVEQIPVISEVDRHLEKFGWGALPVSGFIPPAAFMEFQSLGLLPIACDMRTLEHLTYTPAPDIVHEAAGHAPILINADYAAYLKQYGEVARHAIISKQDLDQYEAIRVLSDVKENPLSTSDDIQAAEAALQKVNAAMTGVSEAALLSRMNWWTAEYGLIGEITKPRIFGAGLLSSVGESAECLNPKVKKIPLSVDCVDYSYDITEPQPQLFVAKDFSQLGEVLESLAKQLAYRRGGVYGLNRAIEAETVNTVELNSGLQISGQLKDFIADDQGAPIYLRFMGSCQLAVAGQEIAGQGIQHHAHGFSSPLGLLEGSYPDLQKSDFKPGQRTRLQFKSGVVVDGIFKGSTYSAQNKLVLLTWTDCKVTLGDQVLFDPSWGEYDMAVGTTVTSVFAGPADRLHFGQTSDFVAKRVPTRQFSQDEMVRHKLYQDIRKVRTERLSPSEVKNLVTRFLAQPRQDWLMGVELLELCHQCGLSDESFKQLQLTLDPGKFPEGAVRQSVKDGLRLAQLKN